MIYTHEGWFGFCPVYLANPFGNCPDVTYKYRWLKPVLHFNVMLQQAAIVTCALMFPEWAPVWKIRVTRRLEKPVRC